MLPPGLSISLADIKIQPCKLCGSTSDARREEAPSSEHEYEKVVRAAIKPLILGLLSIILGLDQSQFGRLPLV